MIKDKLLTAQSRQKHYVDKRRRPLEFEIGETPVTTIGRSLKSIKLSSRYLGPFQILKKFGTIAFKLALSPNLSNIYDVFHVSQLKRYLPDHSHIIEHENLHLQENMIYEIRQDRIIDT